MFHGEFSDESYILYYLKRYNTSFSVMDETAEVQHAASLLSVPWA
jgi:hypothetical protein